MKIFAAVCFMKNVCHWNLCAEFRVSTNILLAYPKVGACPRVGDLMIQGGKKFNAIIEHCQVQTKFDNEAGQICFTSDKSPLPLVNGNSCHGTRFRIR